MKDLQIFNFYIGLGHRQLYLLKTSSGLMTSTSFGIEVILSPNRTLLTCGEIAPRIKTDVIEFAKSRMKKYFTRKSRGNVANSIWFLSSFSYFFQFDCSISWFDQNDPVLCNHENEVIELGSAEWNNHFAWKREEMVIILFKRSSFFVVFHFPFLFSSLLRFWSFR